MGMAVQLHSAPKEYEEEPIELITQAYIQPITEITKKPYPVLKFTVKTKGNYNEAVIYPSFQQVKKIYAELGELMKKIEAMEESEQNEQTNPTTV